ncbi:hypothetical protein LCGC14_1390730, partial [marine sediment metagenome]
PPEFSRPPGTPPELPAGFFRSVPQPSVVKPPGVGIDFLLGDQLTGVNIAASPARIMAFRVEKGGGGGVRSIFMQISGLLATSNITFILAVAGIPVPGFGAIPVAPAVLGVSITNFGTDEVWVEIPPGKEVTFDVTVADAAAYNISGLIHGWQVPAPMANQFAEGWGI